MLHVLACVIVPCLVGSLMYGVVELWDRRRRRSDANDGLPAIDYLI